MTKFFDFLVKYKWIILIIFLLIGGIIFSESFHCGVERNLNKEIKSWEQKNKEIQKRHDEDSVKYVEQQKIYDQKLLDKDKEISDIQLSLNKSKQQLKDELAKTKKYNATQTLNAFIEKTNPPETEKSTIIPQLIVLKEHPNDTGAIVPIKNISNGLDGLIERDFNLIAVEKLNLEVKKLNEKVQIEEDRHTSDQSQINNLNRDYNDMKQQVGKADTIIKDQKKIIRKQRWAIIGTAVGGAAALILGVVVAVAH